MMRRKEDHLRICTEENVEAGNPGFSQVRLKHKSAPEISLSDVDTNIRFLGKRLKFPLIFEAMTGGMAQAENINKTLAGLAEEFGLGMGVGSQRPSLDDPSLASTYAVRDVAPQILLIANLGAVQLNYGYGLQECRMAVEQIEADALAIHLNALQEAVQPEGNTDFRGLIRKINGVAKGLKQPVIVKEVGCGLDLQTAKKLKVSALDCAGSGGTSWSLVESQRNEGIMQAVGETFSSWGQPTAESVSSLSRLKTPLIASGGVRTGLDGAKCIALGADVAGVALPLLRCYNEGGEKCVRAYVERFIIEFKTAMFLTGSTNVRQLKGRVL